jgi:hypothetical protein
MELHDYHQYFGYRIADLPGYQALMTAALLSSAEADADARGRKETRGTRKHKEKEKEYLQARETYSRAKETLSDKRSSKRNRYSFHKRVVTPLISVNERVVESMATAKLNYSHAKTTPSGDLDPGHIQVGMQNMAIFEEPSFGQRKKHPSKSLSIKRNYVEMHKTHTGPRAGLSPEAVLTVMAYLDYQALQFATPHHFAIGRLAVVIFEVLPQPSFPSSASPNSNTLALM